MTGRRGRWSSSPRAKGWTAAAVVATLIVGGLGIAAAQNDPGPPPAPPTSPPPGGDPEGAGRGRRLDEPGRHGRGRPFGPMGALHGEFVTPSGSGYRTLAVQRGRVTQVSSGSITLRSDDGFTRTYALDDNTVVSAGRDGIGDVKEGDTVGVTAVVDGGTARAMRLHDATTTEAIRRHRAPS